MKRKTRLGLVSLVILGLAVLFTIHVAAECQGLACCWDDYRNALKNCATDWGAPINADAETQEQAEAREMNLRACLDGAKMILEACIGQVTEPPDGPSHTQSVTFMPNGQYVLTTTQPKGTSPQAYEFSLSVPQGHGGQYTLTILNGMPGDAPYPEYLQRVAGTIAVNGVKAVDEFTLNEDEHQLDVPVTLVEGNNSLTVEINQEDESWFGFATIVIRNW